MFYKKLVIGALASVTACFSFAEDSGLSYTHIGLSYQSVELDEEDGDGYAIAGNMAINDSFFLLGQYSSIAIVDDFELAMLGLGIGYHTAMATNVDFVTSLSFVGAKTDFDGDSNDANGSLIAAGVRAKPTKTLELGAAINYIDIENEGAVGYSLSGRVFATPKFSLGLGLESVVNIDRISLDVRFDL